MNALTVDMALGCSTNTMLHLPAIAHEAGVDFNLDIRKRDKRQRLLTSAILHRQDIIIWKNLTRQVEFMQL